MALSTYKKRSGTFDRGKDYEWLLCAYYSLKLSLSSEVADFQLFTNNEFFGDFDDIALRVRFVDGSLRIFLLQLKHSEKNKNVALTSLTSPSGDFTLLKYKKSHDSCIGLGNFNYVLYTNRSAKFKNGTKIRVGGEDVVIYQHTCVGGGLLDTNSTRNCSVFRFEAVPDRGSDFFRNFYLYVNQQNDTNLKQSILDLLKNSLHCDVYTTFVEFMRSWWGGNFKLTKEDVVAKVAELVLSPMVKTLTCEQINDRTELIKDAILFSDISLVSESSRVTKIWTRSQNTDVKHVSLTALKFGLVTKGVSKVEDLPPEKRSKVFWFMDEVPLIVECQSSKKKQISAIISLLERHRQKKKLVLVGEIPEVNLDRWKTLRCLADVRPEELRQRIATGFVCNLQGKRSVTLEELGGTDSAFEVAQLLEIATTDSFNIGENLEKLPPVYIPRSFYKILVDYKAIDESKEAEIFLSCNNQKIPPRKIRKRKVPFPSEETSGTFFKHHVYISKDEFKRDLIEKKCAHHFRIIDSQNLQWLSSTEVLPKYKRIDPNHVLSESEIDDHFHNKIRLLTSHTGTGKTSFLNRIKNEAPPDHLVIKMNLKEHSKFFKSCTGSDVWSYIVLFTKNDRKYSPFEVKIMEKFSKDKVLLLWDGFDDLHDDSKDKFIKSVINLRNSGISQWITAQNRSQKFLEEALGVFSMTLLPFSEDEQMCYIQKRCGVLDDTVLKNFYENMRIVDNQEYLGVPLQLYILTDIFCKNPKLLETVYTLTDIFAAYIDGKYDHFLITEGTSTEIRSFRSLIENAKAYRLSQYKIAGLRTHFPELCLQNDETFVDDVKGGDFLDLIVGVDDVGRFVFEHQILGEYLSALYLAENRPPGIQEYLFNDACRNIRFMFDLLLADKDPIFIAILYKKFDTVGTSTTRDKAGRSPLHVICSYGRKHPVRVGSTVCEEDDNLKAIVRVLSKTCNPFDKDELFKWTSYDYAERSYSLGLIEVLGTNLESVICDLRCYDLGTILYYAIKMNYSKLFASVRVVPYFADSNGHNLLHLAIEFKREKYLTSLLSQETYTRLINKPNGDHWTPLHLATFNGDLQLVKVLIIKGATIKLREPSLMSLAVAKGRKDMVEFFLGCGCSPNEFYHTNYFTTSIYQAIDQKLDDIVDLLLKHGAKLLCVNRNHFMVHEKPNPFGLNLFHLLVENEQFAEAEAVLKRGIHVDSVDYEGRTAIHHAASNNKESVIRFLLAKGGNCRVLDNSGQSPLHCAAKAGSMEVADILISNGCDYNLQDGDGMTPLHRAVLNGQVSFVAFLVKKGVNPNLRNMHGRVPMHMAAKYDLSECIRILYENGANLEERDFLYGRTPLHFAAWGGHDDSVRTLLEIGAEVNSSCNFGFTPLHLAVEDSRLETCKLLLKAGASVSVVNRNGSTPLNLVDKNDLEMCRFVLEYEKLPLHSAALRCHPDFISELVSMGYDVNERDDNGDTILHLAVRYTRDLDVELIKMGADVTAQNRFGYTPLHCALQVPFTLKVRVERLLSAEVVNCATSTGLTPLHLAAQSSLAEAVDIVRLLLEKGAKIDATDRDGFAPLHYAALVGNLDVVTILSRIDNVALHMAATGGHVRVVEYLLGQNVPVDKTCLDGAMNNEHPEVLRVLLDQKPDFDVCSTNHKGRTLLHMSAKKGRLHLVRYFEPKVPVNAVDNDGTTAIEEALYNRHYDVFSFLLEKSDFDVNKYSGRYKQYPLHLVACTGKLNLVKLFIERGARIDVLDEDGNTPLHNSVNYAHDDVFTYLLKLSSTTVLNSRNKRGETPLHVASNLLVREIMDAFIDRGADVNLVDNEGNTPFDTCCNHGVLHKEMLQKLRNVDIEKRYGSNGKTLLHMSDDIEITQWLIQKGASINAKDTKGNTPLHLVARKDTKMLTLLMDNCKGVDLNATNDLGETVLHLAALSSLPNVEEILKRGALPSVANKFGQIPLHYALRRPKIFKYLWSETPDVDIFKMAGHTSRTVLHEAAAQGDLESVKFFSGIGLKSNDPDEKANTPLWEAARCRNLEALEFMLQLDKKSVDVCDSRGMTLLHFAADQDNFGLVKVLVKYGARGDLCDEGGRNAADIASKKGHKEIYRFLTASGKNRQCLTA